MLPYKLIQKDFIIVGQGIAGTLLSHELMRLGKEVIVIDKANEHKSSLVAGAVLNPMAGKHWSPAPKAALFLPKAVQVYRDMEKELHVSILKETCLNVFHETPEKHQLFEQQVKLHPQYFETSRKADSALFQDETFGIINGLYLVDGITLLQAWKQYLEHKNAFVSGEFDWNTIAAAGSRVVYKDWEASKIIFCTGAEAMMQPFFKNLPFTANRGEALILSIPDLPLNAIYHKKLRLVPRSDGLFWCGSNYNWKFENLDPDLEWREKAILDLKEWLKIPFTIEEHLVARRPTTAGQLPLMGIHPQHTSTAIFNGLGTRGFSSGPYWAHEFAKQLLDTSYEVPDYRFPLK